MTNAEVMTAGDRDDEDGSDQEQDYFNQDGGWQNPAAEGREWPDPMEIHRSHESLEDAVSRMVVWDDKYTENQELQRYWAEGKAFPEPFKYHPETENKFLAREEELKRHERVYVALEQRRADEAIRALTVPAAPEKPPVPGLYHLLKFDDSVTLPWSWDHDSGDSFRKAWEDTYSTREFQDQLMACLWWWTAKKVNDT